MSIHSRITITCFLVLSFALAASSEPPPPPPGPQNGPSMEKGDVPYGILRALNLTDAQKATLKESHHATRKDRKQQRTLRIQWEQQLMDALLSNPMDQEKLAEAQQGLLELDEQRFTSHVEQIQTLLSVLTDTQKTQFKILLQEHRQKRLEKKRQWLDRDSTGIKQRRRHGPPHQYGDDCPPCPCAPEEED